MINRSKQRFIAYVFFTISFLFIVLNLIDTQNEHINNNWYITVEPGDQDRIFVFDANIPYTIHSDDYILYYAFMSRGTKGDYIVDRSYSYSAPEGLEKVLGGAKGPISLKSFNLTCEKQTYFKIKVQLSGMFIEDGSYKIHRNKSEARFSFYYNNTKKLLTKYKDF